MISAILKAIPAIASIFKSLGGFFKFVIENARQKKAIKHKEEIAIVTEELQNAKTDDERRKLVERLNKL